ncbi:hypothetical protein [Amycolatopsis sp. NPDC051903]|uniref:hypothetical protein n=1 Tax=Amycolatopsis sp. NPDC051903 TaxID=3363936 RepID=UPI00378B4197
MTGESLFACEKAFGNDSSIVSLDQGERDTPCIDKGRFFANKPASVPVLHEDRAGGVMQISEFNRNISARLAAVVASRRPQLLTRGKDQQPYVTMVPHDLFEDLLAAAGKKGRRVLARHEAAAQNCATQEELPLTA